MMPNKIPIMKVRKVLFRIVSRSSQLVTHCQPARPHTLIISEDLKSSPAHTEILDDVKQFLWFLFASVVWLFCYNHISVDIAMNKVAINLGLSEQKGRAIHFFVLCHVSPSNSAPLCVQTRHSWNHLPSYVV
jgi:hypothetical protein